jgi:glutathione synthase/RimK-type ligase-like ATP-grasp enzyme
MPASAPRIALVTCAKWPALSPSDTAYAKALEAAGATVEVVPWNLPGALASLRGADLTVMRGAWDYHDHIDAFRVFLDAVDASGIRFLNPTSLIRPCLEKQNFADLLVPGIEVPRSHRCRHDAAQIAAAMDEEGWTRAVLKPVSGASGRGVQLARRDALPAVLAEIAADVGERDLLVQAFIPEIAAGEEQIVLFDGIASHAQRKLPPPGEFRTSSVHAPERTRIDPLPDYVPRVEAMVRRMAPVPLYARIDVVRRGDDLVLIECEINEPGLLLDRAPGSAERFARATLARLA